MTGRARLALVRRSIGFVVALAGALPALAATCTSNTVGPANWSAVTWTGCVAPAVGDTVIISNGNTVRLDVATFNSTANALASLTVNGTLTMGNSGTNRTLFVSGGVTVAGTLDTWPNNNSTHTLNIGGNLSNTGTVDLFSVAARVTNVAFNGTLAQTVSGGGTYEFNNVTVSNATTFNSTVTTATVVGITAANAATTNSGTLTTTGVVTIAAGNIVTNNGTWTAGSITGLNATTSHWTQGNGGTLNVSGVLMAFGVLNASASNNTVNYNSAGAQNIKIASSNDYFNLTVSGGNTKTGLAGAYDILGAFVIGTGTTFTANTNDPTMNVTGAMTVTGTYQSSNTAVLNVTGDLSIGGTYTGNGGAATLKGNFTRTGTFTSGAGIFTFNSTTAAQSISGATTFTNLTFANTTSTGVTLSSGNVTVSGTGAGALTLDGIVTTGTNTLIVSQNGATVVTRNAGFVDGNLQRLFPAAAAVRRFDVGSSGRYAPFEITFAASPGANTMTVSTTTGDHTSIGLSAIDPNFTVSRFWTVTSTIVQTYSAVFTFVNLSPPDNPSDDVDDDTNTGAFIVQRFSGGTWNNTTIGTRTATTTQITGATGFGAFQIGEGRPTAGSASFNAVEVGANAVTGVIKTKIAASGFNLDLVALNAARNAINTSFKGPVSVELLNASNNSAGLDANGCRSSWTNIQTFSATFSASDNGREQNVSFTENNIYQDVRVRVKYTIAGTDLLVGCSSDNFAIRPNTFASFTVTDQDWENAGTGRTLNNAGTSGGAVHKAGRPFTMEATAVNAVGTTMTAYPVTSSPFVVSAAVVPVGGAPGTVTPGTWGIASGVALTTSATFDEAGVVTMRLEDRTFAAVDASDSSDAERFVVGPDLSVGRFVPDHFAFASIPAPSTPQFRTYDAVCAGTRSFTYIGQSFWYATLPSARLEAQNATGGVTSNYRGSLFKLTGLTNNGLTEAYNNNGTGPGLDTAMIGTPSLTAGDGSPGNSFGTGLYSANASGTILYSRDNSTLTAPFTSNVSLTVNASDNSEASFSGNGTITTSSSLVFNGGGTGIAFDGSNFSPPTFMAGKTFVYGRARMLNGAGPTTVDVPVTLTTEYYASATSGFMLNTADNCTSFAANNFKLFDHQGSINTTNMPDDASKISVSAVTAGKSNLKLVKPTTPPPISTPGSVKICLNLDAGTGGDASCSTTTGTGKTWLQGPWGAATYTRDPSGQMAYGLYGAQPKNFIFFRENY